MKTPKFWKKKNLLILILLPFSKIYYLFFLINNYLKKEIKFKTPIICVGNVVIGGAGKTPIVIKLREYLKTNFSKIFVLSRGYGGRLKGPLIIKRNMNFLDVGDECLIHSIHGDTCIAKNKVSGARFCESQNANLIILDDGLQSKNVKKDFSILVIDSEYGFGNKLIFPAGPLREPLRNAINRSDAIIVFGDKKILKNDLPPDKIFFADRVLKIGKFKNKRVIAFCGLGNNDNFFYNLRKNSIKIIETVNFPDHHKYSYDEIKKIVNLAKLKKLHIVCTKKDFMKLPKIFQPIDLDIKIHKNEKLKELIIKSIQLKKSVLNQ